MTNELHWRKSTFTDNGNCVEIAEVGDSVLVRNSNHREAGALALTRAQFAGWLRGRQSGEFDDLAVRHEAL